MLDRRTKQNLLVTVTGVCLFAALMNFGALLRFGSGVVNIIMPIIAGIIFALFLNVPVSGLQKRLLSVSRKWKRRPSENAWRRISFVIVMAGIVLIIVLVSMMLIPELARSISSTYVLLQQRLPEWAEALESANIPLPEENPGNGNLQEIMEYIDNLLNNSSDSLNAMFSAAWGTLAAAFSRVTTLGFGLIIGIYLVLSKERTKRHVHKFIYGFLPDKAADRIFYTARLFRNSFTHFLTGQCLEAVILGILMFLAFTIFRLPYASLVGVMTAFCAIIPYVGAFISCAVSLLLTALVDPTLILRAAVVYLCVQFVENQFIYPRVVGGSVGMPALYTLIAAMIGGKMFGIIGILFSIPLMAVFIELVKAAANRRIREKQTVSAS